RDESRRRKGTGGFGSGRNGHFPRRVTNKVPIGGRELPNDQFRTPEQRDTRWGLPRGCRTGRQGGRGRRAKPPPAADVRVSLWVAHGHYPLFSAVTSGSVRFPQAIDKR